MYLLQHLLPAPRVDAPERFLARALDAGATEPSRVASVRSLHGLALPRLKDIARALVAILNEPRYWLPSEVLSLLALTEPRVFIGVVDARFVLAPSPVASLIADRDGMLHCATIGRVVLPQHIAALAHLVPSLPWLGDAPAHRRGYL